MGLGTRRLLNGLAGAVVALAAIFPAKANIAENAEKLALVRDGLTTEASADWWGFDEQDSTAILQAALDSGVEKLAIPNMGSPWITGPLQLPDNIEIEVAEGAVVEALRGEFKGLKDALFTAFGKSNITIRGYGATFRMHKEDYQNPELYEPAEWRHVINLLSSSDITIEGLTLKSSGGDGVYIGRNSSLPLSHCQEVIIRDCHIDDNHRQGISVIRVRNLLIENCHISNTRGTAPQAGIDFEGSLFDNVTVRNTTFVNNENAAVIIQTVVEEGGDPVSFNFEDCHAISNRSGFAVSFGNPNPPMELIDCYMTNCTVVNRDGQTMVFNDFWHDLMKTPRLSRTEKEVVGKLRRTRLNRRRIQPISMPPTPVLPAGVAAPAAQLPSQRGSAQYILYAQTGNDVSFSARHKSLKSNSKPMTVTVTAPSGAKIPLDVPEILDTTVNLSFVAPETGAYLIEFDAGRSVGWINSTGNIPIAIVADEKPIHFLASQNRLYFYVPPRAREFYILVTGEGNERVKANIFDANGELVVQGDDISGAHHLVVQREEASEGEVWTLQAERASNYGIEDYFVDLIGVPPILANSVDGLLEPLGAEWLGDWDFRRELVIDATQIGQDLTNFPLMVRVDSGIIDFEVARPDGHDIRFTAGDGATILDYEREQHDQLQGQAVYWVRIPLVSSVTSTSLYVYYGNRQATDGANPTAVWDDNYEAVWHLASENGATQPDSTAKARHLDVYGEPDEGAPGIIGSGIGVDGSNDNPVYLITPKVDNAYPEIDTTRGLTFSAWAYSTNDATSGYGQYPRPIIAMGGGNWGTPWWSYRFGYHNNNRLGAYASGSTGLADFGNSGKLSTGFIRDSWNHVAMTLYYDEAADETRMRTYSDGVRIGDYTVGGNALRNPLTGRPIVVAGYTHSSWPSNNPQDYFNGWIDEGRVSNTERSEAWLAASFHNQKPISTLIVPKPAESSADWYQGWRYRRRINIKGDHIVEDLHDFPLLVRLDAQCFDFDLARADGHDIRFTAGDSAAPLDFEREEHDAAKNQGAYWVKIPLLPAGVGTNMYIYYGKTGAVDASSARTWDASHVAVWHLSQSGEERQDDSTRNAYDLAVFGDVAEGAPGIVGQAIETAGTTENPHFLMAPTNSPYPSIDTTDGLTYSAWARPSSDNISEDSMIIAIGGGNWSPYWGIYLYYRKNGYLRAYAPIHGTMSYNGMPIDEWSHVAMTLRYDEANQENTMLLYLNGAQVSSSVVTNELRNPLASRPLLLGARTQSPWPNNMPSRFFVGGIDEARISNTRRSAAWLAASYHSQKPDSDMLSFDRREPPSGSVILIR